MKLVGFIKEHDHKLGYSFNDVMQKSLKEYDTEVIINYLDKGVLIFGWMGYSMILKLMNPLRHLHIILMASGYGHLIFRII